MTRKIPKQPQDYSFTPMRPCKHFIVFVITFFSVTVWKEKTGRNQNQNTPVCVILLLLFFLLYFPVCAVWIYTFFPVIHKIIWCPNFSLKEPNEAVLLGVQVRQLCGIIQMYAEWTTLTSSQIHNVDIQTIYHPLSRSPLIRCKQTEAVLDIAK